MKAHKHIFFFVLLNLGFIAVMPAQCLFFSPALGYNCVAGQPSINYTITGATAPYTFTYVNVATNATVITGSSATGIGTVNAVPAAIYIVYVADANGCLVS
ncbi:MAG TPA: hypothetical protein PL029_11750, partial [Bacteroidia bacterium]|nr:hypothetical protein [Bacteroidia bacterium]